MPFNPTKTLFTLSAGVLLVASSVTSSDAKPHGNQLTPQSELTYYHSDYNSPRDQDNSGFLSSGPPEIYACSSSGG